MRTEPDGRAMRPNIVLASGSPRRKELVTRLGWTFTVIAPDVDEDVSGAPESVVELLSERKARAAANMADGIILAADTLVALDDEVLGKPKDEADARRMLRQLSGRTHQVYTGVCMLDARSERMEKVVERSDVTFRPLTDEEIEAYIATGEPMDKAGAYGVQGTARAFVTGINGEFENVMGLPISVLPGLYDRLTAREF